MSLDSTLECIQDTPCETQPDDFPLDEIEDEAAVYEYHRLKHKWCMWLMFNPITTNKQQNKTNVDWANQQILMHEFDVAEEYWQLQNNIISPTELGNGDYFLFKSGITPAWEDSAFKAGGRWVLKLPAKMKYAANRIWPHLCVAVLAAGLAEEESICGVVISVRDKTLKIAIWLSTCEEKKVMPVGRDFVYLLSEFIDTKDNRIGFNIFSAHSPNAEEYKVSASELVI